MKTETEKFTSESLKLTGLLLLATILSLAGCSTQPRPDPLVGWRISSLKTIYANKMVLDDCKNYIHTLSTEEQNAAGPMFYYENGTGQHAVKIEIGIKDTWWDHVLIYDENDKRIKTIKYSNGGYQS